MTMKALLRDLPATIEGHPSRDPSVLHTLEPWKVEFREVICIGVQPTI